MVYKKIIIQNLGFSITRLLRRYASLLSDTLASRSSPLFWMYSSTGVKPPLLKGTQIKSYANGKKVYVIYRVGHLLADLGWVDLDLECSIILPGQ